MGALLNGIREKQLADELKIRVRKKCGQRKNWHPNFYLH